MDNKEKFFNLIVNSYQDSFQIGDLGDVVTEATGPYDNFICELLNISDEEYERMIDEAYDIAYNSYYEDMLKKFKKAE